MHGADITFQSLIGGPITLLNYVPVQEIYVNDITLLPFYKCIRDTSRATKVVAFIFHPH